MFFRSRRGQVSAIDALIAITIFFVVFFIFTRNADLLMPRQQVLFNDAYARAQRIAFSLTENGGFPSNWNSTNYVILGVAGTNRLVLSEAKVLELVTAPPLEVADAVGAGDYRLRIRLTNSSGGALWHGRKRSLKIAYTTAGHDATEGDATKSGLRSWLESKSIAFDNYNQTNSKTDFTNLLGNSSAYDTIVLEDSQLSISDLTAPQQTDLQAWVSAGGIIFNKGGANLVTLFGGTFGSVASGAVTPAGASDAFLSRVAQGDSFTCTNAASISDAGGVYTKIVSNANSVIIGMQTVGAGRVYHLCDTQGSVSGSVTLANLRDALNLYAVFGKPFETGETPDSATVSAPVKRTVTFNNTQATFEVTLWK